MMQIQQKQVCITPSMFNFRSRYATFTVIPWNGVCMCGCRLITQRNPQNVSCWVPPRPLARLEGDADGERRGARRAAPAAGTGPRSTARPALAARRHTPPPAERQRGHGPLPSPRGVQWTHAGGGATQILCRCFFLCFSVIPAKFSHLHFALIFLFLFNRFFSFLGLCYVGEALLIYDMSRNQKPVLWQYVPCFCSSVDLVHLFYGSRAR